MAAAVEQPSEKKEVCLLAAPNPGGFGIAAGRDRGRGLGEARRDSKGGPFPKQNLAFVYLTSRNPNEITPPRGPHSKEENG